MFRNRGKLPNINVKSNHENNRKEGYSAPHYSHYWNGNFIIIKYDKTFIIIEFIIMFLLLLIIFAVYLFAYQVSYEDPIATVKDNYLRAQLIAIIASIGLTGLVTIFTKSSKEKLIRNLNIIGFLSIVVMVVLLGIKLNLDSQYNEETFGQFYDQYEQPNNSRQTTDTMSVGVFGVKRLSDKENYIEKSKGAYTNFSVKATIYMIIHIVCVVFIFYLSYRLISIQDNKQRLAKDDVILYDKEENVKY